MHNKCTYSSYRYCQSDHQHRHDFNNNAFFHTINQVMAGIYSPTERTVGTAGKNCHWFFNHFTLTFPKTFYHAGHTGNSMVGKGSRYNRLITVAHYHIKTPGISYILGNIICGKCCGRVGNMFCLVRNFNVFDKISCLCCSSLAGSPV